MWVTEFVMLFSILIIFNISQDKEKKVQIKLKVIAIKKYMIKVVINSYTAVKFFREHPEIYYMAYLSYFIISTYMV